MGKRLLELCPDTRGIRCGVKGVWLLSIAFLLVTDLWGAGSYVPEDRSQPATVTIRGNIHDKLTNSPVAGVSVVDVETGAGTVSHANGEFSITVTQRENVVLRFSFIGMKPVEVTWNGQSSLNVLMEEDVETIGEVVVTGFFERKAESFTGSVATYDRDQLLTIGGHNVLQSLNTLDPSFSIMQNDLYGSDPNRTPEIEVRGKTTISDPRDNYTVDPNQPLFILDGFQVDIEDIIKLNVNRIQSVTLLKDAASTAIYGSKAANGVLVIETNKPQMGKIRVDYGGTFSVDFADLRDYNLMNAEEKLRFETLSGAYLINNENVMQQGYQEMYADRLNRVLSGVDTYWLKQPVRNGFTHKHNVYVSGGDNSITYGMNVDYGNTQGVMKGSGNENIGVGLDLTYRASKFRFSNKVVVDYYDYWNPGVSFSKYAETNPYNAIPDDRTNERYLEYFTIYGGSLNTSTPENDNRSTTTFYAGNPFYNNNLNHIDERQVLRFRDNFVAEWRPINGMRVEARFSVETSRTKREFFKSPYHTDYTETALTERGEYTKTDNQRTRYAGQLIASYFRIFNEVHLINLVGTFDAESDKFNTDAYTVDGFTDDLIPYPSFAGKYGDGLPSFNLSESRQANVFINANYMYDQRYSVDFTLRRDGSSNFGRNNLFTTTWSAGAAWNLHHENFLRNQVDLLKLRFTIGNPGNNNVRYSTETTYRYFNKSSLFGNSLYVSQYGSYGLDWEKTLQINGGLDFTTRDRRFSLVADVYRNTTDPLILRLDLPVSTGRKNLQTNMGRSVTRGFEFKANYNIINRAQERFLWSIGANGATKKSKYENMGDLSELNDAMRELSSLVRYADGTSPTAIWAVRSAGIDPSNGNEVYIKKDGTYTFTYDYHDEVVVGNTEPKLEGIIHTNFRFRGWNASFNLRYIFGADQMNTDLFNRVENVKRADVLTKNQDKRALYDRWQNPGDIAKFKRIDDLDGNSYLTDRFLQKKNWLSGESISVGYDFIGEQWLRKAHIQNLSVRVVLNNIFHSSTIKQERGTEYPYARTATLSLNVTF